MGSDLGTGVPRSGLTSSRQAQGGDRVLYTEKVTKEFDAHGNVVSQNVEHPKPGTLHGESRFDFAMWGRLSFSQAFDDDLAGRNLTGSGGSAMGTGSRGRQAMVSDDYNRTGASETMSGIAPRERTVPGTQHTLGDKLGCELHLRYEDELR